MPEDNYINSELLPLWSAGDMLSGLVLLPVDIPEGDDEEAVKKREKIERFFETFIRALPMGAADIRFENGSIVFTHGLHGYTKCSIEPDLAAKLQAIVARGKPVEVSLMQIDGKRGFRIVRM